MKPVHEKSIIRYLIFEPLGYLLIVGLITGLFIWNFPGNQTQVDYLIATIGVSFLMLIVRRRSLGRPYG